ncbi:hypothetical protein M440DRAFT_251626 [Trichoderma longibrachiatum ATCC 18648]|uniref:Uncharacterized protein n=1 Tax=Trichoderma longibrachiatum ATCC 18648 TaxID=983965 RepID=A0A2T4C8Z7_TRILO|nr:hypothetical protein M440DRAFT_251626 [Trichoderma longibrachiatum ATCC 18648]
MTPTYNPALYPLPYPPVSPKPSPVPSHPFPPTTNLCNERKKKKKSPGHGRKRLIGAVAMSRG